MASIETQHADMIHDAQMDYYGKRLATCSSDKLIKIFNVTGDTITFVADLKGHEGPVWQVAWAHPKFGSMLVSCSYDKKVIIWKETDNGWSKFFEFGRHKASVNSVAWAPHEYGLCLACASSDGHVSVLSFKGVSPSAAVAQADDVLHTIYQPAHQIGATAVSWAPAQAPTSGFAEGAEGAMRLVSGGCDKRVTVWRYERESGELVAESTLQEHSGWVRDVAWSPNVGLPYSTIASCSQNGEVFAWTQRDAGQWELSRVPCGQEVAWRVSWSVTGNILAVTSGSNQVTLYKESLEQEGEWKVVSEMDPQIGSLNAVGE
eukprot:CAMPEP_0114612512 /NCGR_PEP_ID=MMETSP0168-20121206/4660_1 /TAXON_ID=95228 ORGANISM="Vannella sp., Strain DIVA3 517/6/12" /NCGR_SAMPLE_ID=MMETSP0168 /ASSEMBLY_ACC=CAM_ASM_000044 /LENGTH=317 /DNA_ID=CAMNT_0001823499 /DNA_START=50 /DNA_END=1003 /DNA_ORIENTATION=-